MLIMNIIIPAIRSMISAMKSSNLVIIITERFISMIYYFLIPSFAIVIKSRNSCGANESASSLTFLGLISKGHPNV